MIKVCLYGTARVKFGVKEVDMDATSIKELLTKLATKFKVPYKKMKEYLIYVNKINIDTLNMFKTELKDGDQVMLLSPSSGG